MGTIIRSSSKYVEYVLYTEYSWLCSRPPKSKIPQERQTRQNNSPSKQGRSPLIAGRTGRTTSITRIISYPFGRDAASSVPQPAGCQDYQAGRISWPGAVREVLLPSRCAQGLGKSHQRYLTNANPPAACGPTAAAYMMRTAPRVVTSPAVRACRNRNRKMGLPYVTPFDPVLRSHANWDLEGSGGGPGPRFGELVESGAVDRGLPSVQPDLGIDDAVELTSTQCRRIE